MLTYNQLIVKLFKKEIRDRYIDKEILMGQTYRIYSHSDAEKSLNRELGTKVKVFRSFPQPFSEITPEYDGFLGGFECGACIQFEIAVRVPKVRKNIRVVVVHGPNREITVKKNIPGKPTDDTLLFSKSVTNRPTMDGSMSTKHEVNGLRLISVEGGIFQMWEIAIPTRINCKSSNYFLTIQRVYHGRMFNFGSEIYIPENEYEGYSKWPALQKLLEEIVDIRELREIRKPAPPYSELKPTTDNFHKVRYFCLASGTGKAMTRRGLAFIHWTKLVKDVPRFGCLFENQLVQGNFVSRGEKLQLKDVHPV